MKSNELKYKIISAMAEFSITQEDIARAIGVNQTTVSEWTLGRNPRAATLKKLEDYLASLPTSSAKTAPTIKPAPLAKPGDWVRVGRIDACVIASARSGGGLLHVAYLKNGSEAISDVIEWRGDRWNFVFDEPSGQQLDKAWLKALTKGPKK